MRNRALSRHLPASVLLRAQQSRHLTLRSPRGCQLAQHPPAPGENAVSHPSAPWLGRRAPPSRAQDSSFPEQSKRRAVKGSAEVPSLQISPVSFCPFAPRRDSARSTVYSLRVCLIWLEFPPPPTWHSPHSLEHCRPGVLTSTPSARSR